MKDRHRNESVLLLVMEAELARTKERERFWMCVVIAVCAAGMVLALMYGIAMRVWDKAKADYPQPPCEMCGDDLTGGRGCLPVK